MVLLVPCIPIQPCNTGPALFSLLVFLLLKWSALSAATLIMWINGHNVNNLLLSVNAFNLVQTIGFLGTIIERKVAHEGSLLSCWLPAIKLWFDSSPDNEICFI